MVDLHMGMRDLQAGDASGHEEDRRLNLAEPREDHRAPAGSICSNPHAASHFPAIWGTFPEPSRHAVSDDLRALAALTRDATSAGP